jgi:hypothetical protein
VTLGVPDVRLRQIEAQRGKPRPDLLDEIEKAPCAAANVEKSQFALIASGNNFVQLRKGLPSRGIGRSVEQHLDLGYRMLGNTYGRTSFVFAGVPGMQLPVSYSNASGLNVYEQVYNASIFSLYLPIANEADVNNAYDSRQYEDSAFYHTLLMTNHMESDPWEFAEGIRGNGGLLTLRNGKREKNGRLPQPQRVSLPGCPAGLTLAGTSAIAPGSAKQHFAAA